MKKIELANQLLSVQSGIATLEKQANELKAQLLKGLDNGEKIETAFGSVLKVAPTQVLSIAPEKAWNLIKSPENYFKFVKVNVGDLKRAYGESAVVPLGTFEERPACLRVSLNNK